MKLNLLKPLKRIFTALTGEESEDKNLTMIMDKIADAVEEGDASGGGSGLPAVTNADIGKTLEVIDGQSGAEWSVETGRMLIEFEGTGPATTCNKTFSEVVSFLEGNVFNEQNPAKGIRAVLKKHNEYSIELPDIRVLRSDYGNISEIYFYGFFPEGSENTLKTHVVKMTQYRDAYASELDVDYIPDVTSQSSGDVLTIRDSVAIWEEPKPYKVYEITDENATLFETILAQGMATAKVGGSFAARIPSEAGTIGYQVANDLAISRAVLFAVIAPQQSGVATTKRFFHCSGARQFPIAGKNEYHASFMATDYDDDGMYTISFNLCLDLTNTQTFITIHVDYIATPTINS